MKINENKKILIQHLREVPIVAIACKNSGIGRATYYRWRKEDKEFLKESDNALKQGELYLNDLVENQCLSLIKNKHWPSIKYYLDHRHLKYRLEKREKRSYENPRKLACQRLQKNLKRILESK